MSATNIEDLFDEKRLPDGARFVAFILYFPLGIIFAVLRIFIGFHAFIVGAILPKLAIRRVVLRCMCSILGIWVSQEHSENRDPKAKMIVANYTSALDHLAVELVMPNISPSVWDLPPLLIWILGYRDMGAKQGRATLIQNAKKHCQTSSVPLLAFPEGASTNGKTGLLKFSIWPFSLDHPVQPVVIRLSRPTFADVSPSVLGGRWWLDIFWFLFTPYTHFHIKILPTMTNEEEMPEEFTKRVQIQMAKALSIKVTPHTSSDKVEYAKKKLFTEAQERRNHPPPGGPVPDPFLQMAQQVKEVLPHVPLNIIRTDLALTKDVDLTITNILEGRVQFSPEEPGVEATPSTSVANSSQQKQTSATTSPSDVSSGTTSFSKNSQDRHLSLADRKKALVENARRRYLEKQAD
ncbi:hypothetical protein LSH36_274g01040 [Paralvinella palmiformis]|uniref:Lipid droplet-regulating VLDL assembly factor AUP1 n=1 Tax=Paralvinella palmiformis TaxID=53620 RepID=A0AAD9JKP2_9ANNE|nr:hypothetical protein LSH36_274g01040 [Paralvinella palmiformis]